MSTYRPAADVPDPLVLNADQVADALDRLAMDPLRYLEWPWETLDRIAGSIAPGELYFVAARPGVGKTTFLLDWFDHMVTTDPPRNILYVGLEQRPKELRTKWACLRHGISARLMLKPTKEDIYSDLYRESERIVDAELKRQRTPPLRQVSHFASAKRITAGRLEQWVRWAVEYCDVAGVIVDHIDRMDHGDGSGGYQEMVRTVQACKEMAQEYEVGMLIASQLRRTQGDHITAKYQAPTLDDLRGGGIKGEEADCVLGLFRPLKSDITEIELKRARLGQIDEHRLIAPNTTAIRVLKNRLDGAKVGMQATLTFRAGRFTEPPIRSDGRYDV